MQPFGRVMMIINSLWVVLITIDHISQVGVVLGLILVPNGKHFGKMLGDQYSHYEPQSVDVMEMMNLATRILSLSQNDHIIANIPFHIKYFDKTLTLQDLFHQRPHRTLPHNGLGRFTGAGSESPIFKKII